MIKIIVVDDHKLFRMGLIAAFKADYPEINIVGVADCGKVLFDILESTSADIILLDIMLPDINGIEIAGRLRKFYPDIKILAISAEKSSEIVLSMINAGINGFISKENADIEELTKAIKTIMDGFEYFGRDIAPIIYSVYVAKKKSTDITTEFTDREREIIIYCRDGLICKEIADKMNLSINTINTHKKRIFQKLGINTSMEMVRFSLEMGIIKD